MESFFNAFGLQFMLDKESRLRKLANLLVVLGMGLLLLSALQLRPEPIPAREIAQLEPTDPIPTAETSLEATVSAVGVVEQEPESRESPTAAPEPLTPEAVPGNAIELPEGGSDVSNTAQPATRLAIPTLTVDAPVVEVPLTNRTWDVSEVTHEVAHLEGTANPGDKSNIVLTGHVTLRRGSGPFLRLDALQPGDLAIVYAEEQAYTYRVVSKKYVGPTDVSVTFPTSEPILTLITCTNWDAENRTYTERVAVIAELFEEGTP